ncbi:protein similar isoform X3 [Eurosta solidaginis]|uniref:protein similar isoform X3 n=1 Tax=Eurosta solidaginis TaxID=178769 RepID=UPI0035308E69
MSASTNAINNNKSSTLIKRNLYQTKCLSVLLTHWFLMKHQTKTVLKGGYPQQYEEIVPNSNDNITFPQSSDATIQQHTSYQRIEENTNYVTVYPPRNCPALEVVPGITYPIQQIPSEIINLQPEHIPIIINKQQQHQQTLFQNQYQQSHQVILPQQYQQNSYSQQIFHQQILHTNPIRFIQSSLENSSHNYNKNNNDNALSTLQQNSPGFYQRTQTGVDGIGVQQLMGHPPCRGNAPWSYSYCYGDDRNNHEPCHFIKCVDIEDFLNNEKRKEKSRDAARCRRSRETEIFSELAQILPLRKEDVTQLDKASIMRIAIAFLKVRDMLQMFPRVQDLGENLKLDLNIDDSPSKTSAVSTKTDEKFDLLKSADTSQFIKQTLDGFLIILSKDGDITYVSDNITDYLGLATVDILGQQIWEYSHQCDHAELKDALNIKRNSTNDQVKDENKIDYELTTDHRDLFVRLKCTLTSRGRSINIKSASYKVIHITGHLVANMKGDRVLVAIGRPIPHPSNIEIPLGNTTFLTKHSLDMKFTYVDEKMHSLFGYKVNDLLDQSLFEYHHGGDSDRLMATFKTLLSKGQGETCRYRFLGKYGGYCWIVTQATIVYDKMKPQSVVCVNYVISNLENNNEIYSLAQYEASKRKVEECDSENDKGDISDNGSHVNIITTNVNVSSTNNNNKNILKECQSIEYILQKQQENQETLNKTDKNYLHSIKSINQTPIPHLTPTTDNDLSNDRNNNTNKIKNNLYTVIKREQSPIIDTKPLTTSAAPSLNNNKTILRENSLSPLRRNLQTKCFIGNNNSANKKKINIDQNNKNSFIAKKSFEEKRPKSVTASVFRPATSVDLSTSSAGSLSSVLPPITSNTSAVFASTSNASLPPLNAAPRAQSVTASVFTPISQLCLKQQQNTKTYSIISIPTTATTLILSGQEQEQSQPQISTKIHQQQKQQQDMNKFLSFADDATEVAMLKEEPDDLPNFTPASVEGCMRLDETAPFCGEMLLGLCSYSYGGFLPDDYSSLDSSRSSSSPDTPNLGNDSTNSSANNQNNNNNNANRKNNSVNSQQQQTCNSDLNAVTLPNNNNNNNITSNCNKPVVRIDPFINYREESNDTTCSQHLLSPSVASKSPDASSLPSLCSPNSLTQDDGFAFMTMNVDDDIDMTMRAPYIPMNEQEDLPLLTADDLMWCASNGLGNEELNNQKDIDATLQQLQSQQQQQSCNPNLINGYHDVQQHFHSLCSSPASTVSSLSPSPVNHHHQQQQQQQESNCVYNTDTSELAALLCGSGSGTLSILNNNCGHSGSGVGIGVSNAAGCENIDSGLQQQSQQQQSHCVGSGVDFRLQQLQQELVAEHQEQQKRQMKMLGLNIDCKKASSLSPSLCESIEDAFDNVYSKDSTNLDCWNELLQINVGDTSTSASPSPTAALTSPQQQLKGQDDSKSQLQLEQQLSSHHQQQQHQHNVVLNAVPLVTQNAKNIMLQQQQHHSVNKMLINDDMLPVNRGGNKITTIKLINSPTNVTTTTSATAVASPIANSNSASTNTTIRLIDAAKYQQDQQLLQQRQQQQQLQQTSRISQVPQVGKTIFIQQQSYKRHLVSCPYSNQLDPKRVKSTGAAGGGVGMEMHAMPQLLQQLVAKEQQQQQAHKAIGSSARWSSNCATKTSQQSNSVLKNLLISGCDIPDQNNQELLLTNEDYLDQEPSPLLSNISSALTRPLHCQTETPAVLRDYRHNPMIGGPCELPSPPFGPLSSNNSCIDSSSDESSLPDLISAETDSNSDSGIDEIIMNETTKAKIQRSGSPLFKPILGCSAATKDMLLIKCLSNKVAKKRAAMNHLSNEPKLKQKQPQLSAVGDKSNDATTINASANNGQRGRKDSMSTSLDNINTLMEPFIMDLCNDNYDVATEELLEPNEIDQVLTGWTNEIA